MTDAFNGPDHDEDPREKDYISSDGWHQSFAGQKVQAEVLHALGYDPIIPPANAAQIQEPPVSAQCLDLVTSGGLVLHIGARFRVWLVVCFATRRALRTGRRGLIGE